MRMERPWLLQSCRLDSSWGGFYSEQVVDVRPSRHSAILSLSLVPSRRVIWFAALTSTMPFSRDAQGAMDIHWWNIRFGVRRRAMELGVVTSPPTGKYPVPVANRRPRHKHVIRVPHYLTATPCSTANVRFGISKRKTNNTIHFRCSTYSQRGTTSRPRTRRGWNLSRVTRVWRFAVLTCMLDEAPMFLMDSAICTSRFSSVSHFKVTAS
ncbi:hypothetical protein OG21DRAFT_286097 [Imleria badia]|nr:hypothetical protein OG21DRAFT_286097 [Imleria badia]